jgi:hypothetical protein
MLAYICGSTKTGYPSSWQLLLASEMRRNSSLRVVDMGMGEWFDTVSPVLARSGALLSVRHLRL